MLHWGNAASCCVVSADLRHLSYWDVNTMSFGILLADTTSLFMLRYQDMRLEHRHGYSPKKRNERAEPNCMCNDVGDVSVSVGQLCGDPHAAVLPVTQCTPYTESCLCREPDPACPGAFDCIQSDKGTECTATTANTSLYTE